MAPGTAAPGPACTTGDEGLVERTTQMRERGRTRFGVSQLRAWLGTAAHRGALPAMVERVRLVASSASIGSKLPRPTHGGDG
jgi:hypothetical protein